MRNKIWIYIGGVAVILILALSLFGGGMHGNTVRNMDGQSADSSMVGYHGEEQSISSSSEELDKYRSENIPEECRLPEYEDDLDWWKQHLSHHQNTLYCLDYYNNGGE